MDGEYVAWEQKWHYIGQGAFKCLYTTEQPDNVHQRRLRAYWRMLQRHIEPGFRCIELGSGRGTLSQYLQKSGCKVTLVDLAPEALELAKQNWKTHGMSMPTCLQADAAKTGLKTSCADVVHSVGTLEHFRDPQPVISETARLLKPTGLMWHLIVQSSRSDDVHREIREPEAYAEMAAKAGLTATCKQTLFDGVLLLSGHRNEKFVKSGD